MVRAWKGAGVVLRGVRWVEVMLDVAGKVERQDAPIVLGAWDGDSEGAACGRCEVGVAGGMRRRAGGLEMWWSHPGSVEWWVSRACFG